MPLCATRTMLCPVPASERRHAPSPAPRPRAGSRHPEAESRARNLRAPHGGAKLRPQLSERTALELPPVHLGETAVNRGLVEPQQGGGLQCPTQRTRHAGGLREAFRKAPPRTWVRPASLSGTSRRPGCGRPRSRRWCRAGSGRCACGYPQAGECRREVVLAQGGGRVGPARAHARRDPCAAGAPGPTGGRGRRRRRPNPIAARSTGRWRHRPRRRARRPRAQPPPAVRRPGPPGSPCRMPRCRRARRAGRPPRRSPAANRAEPPHARRRARRMARTSLPPPIGLRRRRPARCARGGQSAVPALQRAVDRSSAWHRRASSRLRAAWVWAWRGVRLRRERRRIQEGRKQR